MNDVLTDTRHALLGERSAGRYLGGDEQPLSPRSMQRMRLEGRGPAFLKIGRLVRYQKSDLDEWLMSRRRTSTSDAANSVRRHDCP
jgi:hypothetical protein